jgi:Mg-chelatase subunit ChlD
MVLCFVAPTSAQDADDVRKDLEQSSEYAETGRQLAGLAGEYKLNQHWFPKALLLTEMAKTKDRRAVSQLAIGLSDKDRNVSAFALHGLSQMAPEDVRQGGAAAVFAGLLKSIKVKTPFHRATSRQLFAILVGRDLGAKPGPYKRWLKKHEDELPPMEIEDKSFDPSKFDRELVEQVLAEDGRAATSVRNIREVTTEIRELAENGLDLVLCLDETSTMTPFIEEAKSNLTIMVAVLSQIVKKQRVGLITFNDAVVQNVPLTKNAGQLHEVLQQVQARGGGDIPEGGDKALSTALAPGFGWRKRSSKTVVLVGDAPMHAADVAPTVALVAAAHEKAGITVHMISTPFGRRNEAIPEFTQIAEAGGGQSLLLSQPEKMVSEILLLVFGEKLRPAMEGFVPILLEVLEKQSHPK